MSVVVTTFMLFMYSTSFGTEISPPKIPYRAYSLQKPDLVCSLALIKDGENSPIPATGEYVQFTEGNASIFIIVKNIGTLKSSEFHVRIDVYKNGNFAFTTGKDFPSIDPGNSVKLPAGLGFAEGALLGWSEVKSMVDDTGKVDEIKQGPGDNGQEIGIYN